MSVYNRGMGRSPDVLTFYAPFVARPDVAGTWLTKTFVNDVLLAPVRADGDLERATHVAYQDRPPLAIRSLDHLQSEAVKWTRGMVHLYAGTIAAPVWDLFFELGGAASCVGLKVRTADGDAARAKFAQWLVAWTKGFARVGCDLEIGYLEVPGRAYVAADPSRAGTTWPLGKLALYLGRKHHRADKLHQQILAQISKAPLDRGVHRTVEKDLVIVSFDCACADPDDVARARLQGDRWLLPLVPTRAARGWNEDGDRMIAPWQPVAREPFTFFDKEDKVGYWALTLDPEDQSVDEERWTQLSTIARTGRHRGAKVKAVRLIVPVREEAVVLLDRAAAAGFEMVTYPGDDGVFWQVRED